MRLRGFVAGVDGCVEERGGGVLRGCAAQCGVEANFAFRGNSYFIYAAGFAYEVDCVPASVAECVSN